MRHLAILGLSLCTAPVAAQNVLFQETFDAGIPASWRQIQLGWTGDLWTPGVGPNGSPDVFHEFFCNNGFLWRDNTLLSPPIDLTGFARVDFSCDQVQLFPLQRTLNRVEVTTNNGNSFVAIYNEQGTVSGPGTIQVNMDAFAGLPNVQVGFHYQGTVANEWRLDNVRITTLQPVQAIASLTSGMTAKFSVQGAGAGAVVVFGISLSGSGPLPTPFGNVNLTPPIGILPIQTADANGNASVGLAVPAGLTGLQVFSQAAALPVGGAINFSNWLSRTVQ